ncbi:hypothetical protein O9X98_14785 [Agrobacterium salinitolerans]|nr:hypothetical protein [Agrobacterium salinitolerans]
MNDNVSSRFHLQSVRHAKNVAKNVKGFLETLGYDVKLSQAQTLVASLYGYKDWHELEVSVNPGFPVGPVDSQLSLEAAAARRDRHLGVLRGFGIAPHAANLVLDKCAPTAGQPVLARELLWTASGLGILECAKTSFMPAMRIYEGRLDKSRFDPLRPDLSAEAKKLTLPGFSVYGVYGDTQRFDHAIAEGETLEAVKELAEAKWRDAQIAEQDLKAKGRKTTPVDYEWKVGKNNAYEVESIIEIAEGLYHLKADSCKTYVLAYPAWLRRLPDVFRPSDIEEGVPHLHYLGSSGQMFPLCFPDLYTRHEVEVAVKIGQYEFPEAYAAFVLGEAADEHTLARGTRGFGTTGRDYRLLDELGDADNGDKRVLATLEKVIGQDYDEAEFGKLYIFRIKADQFEAFEMNMGEIDETVHELEGVYHETFDEYRKARKLGPWSGNPPKGPRFH